MDLVGAQISSLANTLQLVSGQTLEKLDPKMHTHMITIQVFCSTVLRFDLI